MPRVRERDLVPFDDYQRIRQQLFDKVKQTVGRTFPIENKQYSLTVEDLDYSDPDHLTKAQHREAILKNGTLSRRLTGKLVLRDRETGKPVTATGKKTIMNVPYLTDYGTFVRRGVEYAVPKQMRMVPGVFVRRTADGFPEAQFNIKQGTGRSFRIYMEPDTSMFYIRSGHRKVPLYPVLKSMGVEDEELEETWGKDILKANQTGRTSSHASRWMQEAAAQGMSRRERMQGI